MIVAGTVFIVVQLGIHVVQQEIVVQKYVLEHYQSGIDVQLGIGVLIDNYCMSILDGCWHD